MRSPVGIAAVLAFAWCHTAAAQIAIDVGATHQTMHGFGASAMVWEDPHLTETAGAVVPVGVQDQILGSLFTDLGLTRLRSVVDIGLEPYNDNDDPYTFNWSSFNFVGKRNDGHVALVKQALPYGLRTYYPSSLRPEPWITERLPDEHAEWLLAMLLRWKALGVEPPFLSVINEPAEQRSRAWSGDWIRRVIRSLGPRMRQHGLSTMLVVPDDLNATEAFQRAREIMDDADARLYVGALAYHLYGGSRQDMLNIRDLAAKYRIPVWMTEYSQENFADYHGAFGWITTVHRLIADFSVSAVDYMWGFLGKADGRATHSPGHTLVSIAFDRGRYRSHTLTPVFYLTGQFSRFVRPGHVRVEAQSNVDGALVTAYRGPRDLVVVLINSTYAEKDVRFSFTGGPVPGSFSPVRTSPTERWQSLRSVSVNSRAMSAVLPPRSVTTFIGRLGTVDSPAK